MPCLAHVRPAVVVAMVADGRGDVGLEHEQLVEEGGDEVVEGGHGDLPVDVLEPCGGPAGRAPAARAARSIGPCPATSRSSTDASSAPRARRRRGSRTDRSRPSARVADIGAAGEVVDARGGLVMPGFEDAHLHLRGGARSMGGAQLYPLQTVDGDPGRRPRARRPRTRMRPWVLGRGWLYAPFPGGMPTAGLLDRVVPDRPAWHGLLRRPYRLGQHDGDARRRHRPRDARPAQRRDRPRRGGRPDRRVQGRRAAPRGAAHSPARRRPRTGRRSARALAAMHAVGLTAAQDAWLDARRSRVLGAGSTRPASSTCGSAAR